MNELMFQCSHTLFFPPLRSQSPALSHLCSRGHSFPDGGRFIRHGVPQRLADIPLRTAFISEHHGGSCSGCPAKPGHHRCVQRQFNSDSSPKHFTPSSGVTRFLEHSKPHCAPFRMILTYRALIQSLSLIYSIQASSIDTFVLKTVMLDYLIQFYFTFYSPFIISAENPIIATFLGMFNHRAFEYFFYLVVYLKG